MEVNRNEVKAGKLKNRFTVHSNITERRLPAFLVLLVFSSLLFLGGLGRRHLWEADEPRVAGIAADMARSGDFVVPRLNGTPFLEKPPLFFWAEAAAFRIFGESTYAARLVPALSAIGCVIVLFFLALQMNMSVRGAFLSAFVLATSAEFWHLGRNNLIDMTLCFFITASMACFYKLIQSKSGRIFWYVAFVLSLSCAILSKGLVGLVIPLSAFVIWLAAEKDFSLPSWSFLITGTVLSFVPVSIWILLLYNNLGQEAVYRAVWLNNFGRFTGGFPQHVAPFYYYLDKFPGQFMPWTFFLPIAGWLLIREARKREKSNPSLFILTWFVIPFILLSISAGKRSLYLIPIYPAAALAVGYVADWTLNCNEKPSTWFEIPASILAGIAVVTPLVFLGIRFYYHQPFVTSVLLAILGSGLGLYSFLFFYKKDLNNFFQMLAPSFLVIFLTFDMAVTPIFNEKESFEPLFKYAGKLKSEGVQLCLLQPAERLDGAAVFYLKQRVTRFNDFETAHEFMLKTDKIMIISRKEIVEKFPDIHIIEDFNIGEDTIVIFTDKKLAKGN
ncbi:MAG: glycosyltransferase family 39 protein [Sedimentisphaerales bacterium]